MPTTEPMRATLAVLLLAVVFVPTAGAYRLEGGRWPTTTIRYYNEVPAYTWAVDSAAFAWNSSGAHVQFLKSSRTNADVLVGIRGLIDRAGLAVGVHCRMVRPENSGHRGLRGAGPGGCP